MDGKGQGARASSVPNACRAEYNLCQNRNTTRKSVSVLAILIGGFMIQTVQASQFHRFMGTGRTIGVALYAKDAGFLQAICTTHYSRIHQLFNKIDGNRFRQLTRYLQEQVNSTGSGLAGELPFESNRTIEQLLARVLPPDDSSIQFSRPVGVGVSSNLERTLAELFDRYVARYESRPGASRRDKEDIWRVFREPLDKLSITSHLVPKRIEGPDYEYEFERAWKNKIWHVYEPVTFTCSMPGRSWIKRTAGSGAPPASKIAARASRSIC